MIVRDFISAPAVVIGGGVAGLSTALALDGCIVVANEPVGGGSSTLAQGGIAAPLGHGDSPRLHAADTLRVAASLADADVAALVTQSAAGQIGRLRELGVSFDLEPSGALSLGREAGHGRHRIVHAGGDRTGAMVMQTMRAAVLQRPDIQVLEGFQLLELVISRGRTAGVLLEGSDGECLVVLAPHVVLATGGIGGCFEHTTNPPTSRGAGLAAAARCGVTLADLEFVQFHPTALAAGTDPLPLLTEALRGAGAVLIDDAGDRFMCRLHPDAELAPRDVVARSVSQIAARGGRTWLDATGIRDLATRFPGTRELAQTAGLDASRQPLPVVAAAHFHMGGIATDLQGASSLLGLWACGEVASTGLHGGNRLASNSLLEGLVFGQRIAAAIRATRLPPATGPLEIAGRLRPWRGSDERIAELRHIIGGSLGTVRCAASMTAALRRLDAWQPAAQEEANLVVVAQQMLRSALRRRESRGAHQRSDYPACDTAAPARHFIHPRPAAPLVTVEQQRSHVA